MDGWIGGWMNGWMEQQIKVSLFLSLSSSLSQINKYIFKNSYNSPIPKKCGERTVLSFSMNRYFAYLVKCNHISLFFMLVEMR